MTSLAELKCKKVNEMICSMCCPVGLEIEVCVLWDEREEGERERDAERERGGGEG